MCACVCVLHATEALTDKRRLRPRVNVKAVLRYADLGKLTFVYSDLARMTERFRW